jgi:predicted CXXCH cytochrome family protein
VIVRSSEPAELRLGTNSVPLETLAPGVLAAVLSPSAGLHELQLKGGSASQRVSFYVLSVKDDPKAPAGWKEFKPHPSSANCQTCHTVKGNQWSFNTLSFAETCMTCHDTKTFLLGHAHNTEVLSDCVLCHYPHGSTEKFHLKMPRETACKQCHG